MLVCVLNDAHAMFNHAFNYRIIQYLMHVDTPQLFQTVKNHVVLGVCKCEKNDEQRRKKTFKI